MYEIIEPLSTRILYLDTDSAIFVSREGEIEPELGPYLGQLTNELDAYGSGAYITKFLSGGPKFYSYQVKSADNSIKTVCKVKGIRLNFRNSEKVNFESIENLVEHSLDELNILSNDYDATNYKINLQFRARRRTKEYEAITVTESKTCTAVLKKRRFLTHSYSLPFG